MIPQRLSSVVRGSALATGIAALLGTADLASAQQGTFLAQSGLLVIEMESAPTVDDWQFSTSTPGFVGDGYFIWRGPDLFNSPGASGIFGFDFEVQTDATWILSLRNRHEDPDSTEENDVWIRMDGGQWVKVFSNFPGSVGNWTYESRFDFGSSQPMPQASYDLSPGVHRIEFSGRSRNFKMDRLHLHLPGHPGATDPNRPESPRRFGNPFCPPTQNSSGQPSFLEAFGSPRASDGDLVLRCTGLPQGVVGYFLASMDRGSQTTPPGSVGGLCLTGAIGRYAGDILNSGASSTISFRIDTGAIPQPSGSVAALAGDRWNFQFWHRDAGPSGPVSNLSAALEVRFE
ncbi:MAG: hypothetical protein AAF957_15695 [Planctomycetota bacterium]